MAEARSADLVKQDGNWDKFGEDMLVARATTRCVRRYAPDILNKTYLAEELGLIEVSDGQQGTRLVEIDSGEDYHEGATLPPTFDRETGEERTLEAPAPTPPPTPEPPAPAPPAPAQAPRADAPVTDPLGTSGAAATPPPPLDYDEVPEGLHDPGPIGPEPGGDPFDEDTPPAAAPQRMDAAPEDRAPDMPSTGPETREAEAKALIQAQTLPAPHLKAIIDTGTLRGYLLTAGFCPPKDRNAKAAAGYANIDWPALTMEQRLVVIWKADEIAAQGGK
jgi:hypothetical protein